MEGSGEGRVSSGAVGGVLVASYNLVEAEGEEEMSVAVLDCRELSTWFTEAGSEREVSSAVWVGELEDVCVMCGWWMREAAALFIDLSSHGVLGLSDFHYFLQSSEP